MKKLLFGAFIVCTVISHAQTRPYTIASDTVLLKSFGSHGTALVIRSATKDSIGFLYNTGNGVTIFKRALVQINDTTYLIGRDTLHTHGSGGGGTGGGIDSLRKIIATDSIKQYSSGVGTLAFRNQRVFNVMDYGAKGDSITDDTQAFQRAINAADSVRGGTVYVPDPKPYLYYRINGAIDATCNCQIKIPANQSTSIARNHITIVGESRPNYTPVGSGLSFGTTIRARSGTTIKSTLTSFSGVAGAAIIGSDAGSSNNTSLSIENLAFEVKNNPSGTGPVIGGISYKNGSNMYIDFVTVYVDTFAYVSTKPSNDVSGIETPDDNYEDDYSLNHMTVIGFYNGYKIGDWATVNQITAMACYNAYFLKEGNHTTTSLKASALWCRNSIYISAFCNLAYFNLDVEWQNAGKWFDDSTTIKDTANLAHGHVFYSIVAAGGPVDNSKFVKNGGATLYASPHYSGLLANPGPANLTAIYSGFSASVASAVEINKLIPTSSDFGYAALNLVTNQSGTSNAVGTIFFANSNISGVEKRIASVSANTDGATNSGSLTFNLMSAGTFSPFVKFYSGGVEAFGGTTPSLWTNKTGIIEGGGASIFLGQASDIWVTSNGYYNSGWTYKSTAAASNIGLTGGQVLLRVAASGTINTALTWVNGLVVNSNATIQMPHYTAGTATFDASGNITSVSDTRLKNVLGFYKTGLKELMNINPIFYKWNKLSGNEMDSTYAGFSAQNVKANIPYGTGGNKDGYLSLQDRAIMATMVNAIKEQQQEIEDLKKEIKGK